jgi:hypothetical protein
MGVWSLNYHITTSLGLSPTLIFLKFIPNLHRHNGIRVTPTFLKSISDLRRGNSVRVDPDAPPQHIKVLKNFVYIWYGCKMQSVGVWSLNYHITTSLGLLGSALP